MFCKMESKHTMKGKLEGASGAIILIGIGLIFLLDISFWPWILFVVAAPAVLSGIAEGGLWAGLQGGVWLIGIGVLALLDAWWPGILILIGLSMLVGALATPPAVADKRKRKLKPKRGLPLPAGEEDDEF